MTEPILLDARGLLCPLPVLKARKRLRDVPRGARLAMMADDPAAIVDVPHFCNESGNRLISATEAKDHTLYLIEKG